MIRRLLIAAMFVAACFPADAGKSRKSLRFKKKSDRVAIRPEMRLARARAGFPGLQVLANTTAIGANVTGMWWMIPLKLAIPVVRHIAQKRFSE